MEQNKGIALSKMVFLLAKYTLVGQREKGLLAPAMAQAKVAASWWLSLFPQSSLTIREDSNGLRIVVREDTAKSCQVDV